MAMVRSAVVLGQLPGARACVGGLPLAARGVLALREAGFETIALLAPGRPPELAGPLEDRGASVAWPETPGAAQAIALGSRGDVLVLLGNALVDAEALGALRGASRGAVVAPSGQAIGWVVPGDQVAGAVARAVRSAGSGSGADTGGPGTRLEAGLAVAWAGTGSVRSLEDALLAALARRTKTGDSYLAAVIDRRLSRPLTRLLLRTSVTPSEVTLAGLAVGLLGAAGLATVSPGLRVGGVLLLLLSVVLDCVDGELARARFQQSAAGARLDLVGDYLVHLAVFGGLAIGLLREGLPPGGAWAAAALVTGVGAAMVAMHVLSVRPALSGGGDLHWQGGGESLRAAPLGVVAEKLASRDYTYLLLVLALAGHLEWFLYAAAGGSWAFATALLAYRLLAVPARSREPASP